MARPAKLSEADELKRNEQELAEIEARRARLAEAVKNGKSKIEGNRKHLVGAVVISRMTSDPQFREQIVTLLREKVTNPADVELLAPWLSTT